MGRDKATLEYEGRTLVDRVHARLAEIADPVLFATGEVGRLVSLPGPEVADEPGLEGPAAGLIAGLAASPHELLAAVAVDMPFISPSLLRLLADLRLGEDAVVPVDDHGPQVLHAVYARSCLAVLRDAASKGRGLRAALDRLDVRLVPSEVWRVADPSGRFALNLNSPDDLAGLQL